MQLGGGDKLESPRREHTYTALQTEEAERIASAKVTIK